MAIGIFGCKQRLSPTVEAIDTQTTERLRVVDFINDSVGFAMGGTRFSNDVVLRTKDGGKSWEKYPVSISGKGIFTFAFANEKIGFASGADAKMLFTNDGGDTWDFFQMGLWNMIHDIDCFEDSLCLTAAEKGNVFRWSNDQPYWQYLDSLSIEMHDVALVNGHTAYMCGFSAVMKSTDSGRTWSFLSPKNDNFTALSFPTPQVGYVVGRAGSIFKTTDAGATFEILRNGNNLAQPRREINDVKFITPEIGYLVGDNGMFWRTIDGGNTWQILDSNTKAHLMSIALTSASSGFIAGDEGTLIRFEL